MKTDKIVKKMGRPNKYTKEFVKDLAQQLVEWIKVPDNFWLGCFAAENGVDRYRLASLAEEFPDEFSQAYFLAKQVQENKLVMGALNKKLDGHMAWNALMNVAGWRNNNILVDNSVNKQYVQIFRPEAYTNEELAATSRAADRGV